MNEVPIGPGGTPVFSAHQMCSAKLGSDPQTSAAKPNGELHDVKDVWIADAGGMPSCSGVNPARVSVATVKGPPLATSMGPVRRSALVVRRI